MPRPCDDDLYTGLKGLITYDNPGMLTPKGYRKFLQMHIAHEFKMAYSDAKALSDEDITDLLTYLKIMVETDGG